LWGFTIENEQQRTGKPRGGDGSDGTWEWPEHTSEYPDQPKAFWARLTTVQQMEIAAAYINATRDPEE
jgi:hypothetical protein